MSIEDLFEILWNDYKSMTPTAIKVNDILLSRGEKIVNDHIALRTFAHKDLGLGKFENFFSSFGYKKCGDYDFSQKKLNAIHLENIDNPELPKIFISELRYKELSSDCIKIIEDEIENIKKLSVQELFSRELSTSISSQEYEVLYKESEYAAWLCSLGHRPNHFTISLNHLSSIGSLLEFNSILKENSILLNTSGGEVKGSPSVFLEQSSTMADKISVQFSDCLKEVPSCYYEFALRHELPTGERYQGFVTKSADKIFESTNE